MKLAFDRLGSGPPIILVLGAFNTRETGAPLAAALAEHFTVINYDRRGRGGSEDEPTYTVEREVDDLHFLLDQVGGHANVFGFSSGAALALTAARTLAIDHLILFDLPLRLPPFNQPDHAAILAGLSRGDAVEYFQREMVGIPAPVVEQLRTAPFRPALEAMAHTLVYEAKILGDGMIHDLPTCPTLALCGASSPPFMRATTEAFANHQILDTGHDLQPAVLVPPIRSFC
ncbi:MAG TPA: alpha/beta fold hydrolase [Kofleriaceae bacterium]